MNSYLEKLIEKFKSNGLKLTPQRLAVFKILNGNTSHPTAENIYSEIKKDYPTVSFATVYNILKSIGDIDELQELSIDEKNKHFDPNTSFHFHAICEKCHKIVDIFLNQSDIIKIKNRVVKAFEINRCQVNYYGICNDCHKKK